MIWTLVHLYFNCPIPIPYTVNVEIFAGEKYSCFLINSVVPVDTPTLCTKINSRKNLGFMAQSRKCEILLH